MEAPKRGSRQTPLVELTRLLHRVSRIEVREGLNLRLDGTDSIEKSRDVFLGSEYAARQIGSGCARRQTYQTIVAHISVS